MVLKRLEKAIRALFIRGMSTVMGRARRGGAPAWDARPHRVLYLRYDRIGDMILSSGLIRAIATSHPGMTIDILASPRNASVLEGDPYVGSVILFDKKKPLSYLRTLRQMRRGHYDAVLDCMVLSPSTTALILMLLSGARHRIGIGGRSNDYIYTIPVPPLAPRGHYLERAAALALPFGVDIDTFDWRPTVALSDDELAGGEAMWRSHQEAGGRGGDRSRRLLVNITAGKPICSWPDEKFIAALTHVRTHAPDVAMLAIGMPSEAERIAHIAHEVGIPVARTPGIRHALALVAAADYVFTPDTSIVHAASAFRKPAVVMFPHREPEPYGLYRSPGRMVVGPDEVLASLPVEPVIAALDEMLDGAFDDYSAQRDREAESKAGARVGGD